MTDHESVFDEDRLFMRALYWLATGGEGDLPWGLRVSWKLAAWSGVAVLIYAQLTAPHRDMFMHVVLTCLTAFWFLMALFIRLGED